jgi:hypothetical protein
MTSPFNIAGSHPAAPPKACRTPRCGGAMKPAGGGVDKVLPAGPEFAFRLWACGKCGRPYGLVLKHLF